MMVAAAVAQLGRLADSRSIVSSAARAGSLLAKAEVSLEAARIESEFGSADAAREWLKQLDPTLLSRGHMGIHNLLDGEIAMRHGDISAAQSSLANLSLDRCADAAGKLRTQILATRIALQRDGQLAKGAAEEAARIATAQRTRRGSHLAALLLAAANGEGLDEAISQSVSNAFCWSLVAEELTGRLHMMSIDSRAHLAREAALRPDRWRTPLARAIQAHADAASHASAMLAEFGSADDATMLRKAARSNKSLRTSALAITKRLAQSVTISDLGAVQVFVGGEDEPRYLRRKVLSLVCFLASRPRMAANREEVIDALWPDLGVEAGGNSLHQAIYFLRRVLEPDYREGMSAGYIHFDGDIVSLNSELVEVVSRTCWLLIDRVKAGDEQALEGLLRDYRARYALTFAYEEWASTYRENLHAAALGASEVAMIRAQERGDYDAAIRVGQAMLAVDPQADAIELELLRAYKRSGRRAAAAEQYAHYAAYVRSELAAEPPSYDEV
jgi:DNA-binding SARP family transcriptional activator